jgi:hypothetical protein
MIRTSVFLGILLPIASVGCDSRPSDVAVNPGECYCELSKPEVTHRDGKLTFKVQYTFPDGPPKYEAWYSCTFDIIGSSTSSVTVKKMGKDMQPVGDFVATTNAQFLRTLSARFVVTVKQSDSKDGVYNVVSAPFAAGF